MLKISYIILVPALAATWVDGASTLSQSKAISEPVSETSGVWNTQAYLEQKLREKGVLKAEQHLAPHEVWELVDFLNARVEARTK